MTIVSPEICKEIWAMKAKGVPSCYIARDIGIRIEIVDAVLKGEAEGPSRQPVRRKAKPAPKVEEEPEPTAKRKERPSRKTYVSASLEERSARAKIRRERLARENPSLYEPLSDKDVAESMAWLADIF